MKKIRNIIIGILFLVAAAILIPIYISRSAKEDTMLVAFYDLPSDIVIALTEWIDSRSIDWQPVVLDTNEPLDTYIKVPVRYNLLFTYDSKSMDSVATFALSAETSVLMMMPIPVRISVQTKGRLTATPVLADHFQVSCNIDVLTKQGTSQPGAIFLLEEIATNAMLESTSSIAASPLLCAGNNDDHLIMLFSSLLETMHGIEVWDAAVLVLEESATSLKESDLITESAFFDFFALPEVYDTLQLLARWRVQGLLPKTWLSLSTEAIASAMEQKTATFVFAPLSFINTLPESTRRQYAPWYMPSGSVTSGRFLTAPLVTVMQFSLVKSPLQSARQASEKANTANFLVRELATSRAQAQLSTATNLVPVNETAKTPDSTVEETREWFAASNGLIPDIARASLALSEERIWFAQTLRNLLSQM